MTNRSEVEVVKTRGKGLMLTGAAIMLLGAFSCIGGGTDAGASAFFFGALIHGAGRLFRWFYHS